MASLSFTDIQTRVMNDCRVPTTNTTEATKFAAVINAVYRDICSKQDWWWLEKRTVINTAPNLVAGATNVFGVAAPASVSVTINSTVATFSSAIAQNIANFSILFPGGSDDSLAVYRIAATSTAGANPVNLDAAFTNATSTAASYNLYQDAYDMPSDTNKLLQVKRFGYAQPLRLIGKNEMMQLKIVDTTTGKPEVATLLDFDTSGDPTTVRQLVVHPYPDKAYRLEVLYKQTLNTELAGSTQPLIPDDFRQILVYGSLARCYPIFLNDVERGKFYEALFNDVLALMAAQQKEYAHDQSGIAPWDSYRRRAQRGRVAGSYTLGSWFDRLPNQP